MNNLISKLLHTHGSVALLPLRFGTGIILAAHGSQKLFGWFGGYGLAGTAGFFESQLGMAPGILWAFLASAGEFFGGLMLIAGALTRIGAALNVVTMAVAIILVHPNAFFSANNGMEFPLILLAANATLLIAGAGGWSVDRVLASRLARVPEKVSVNPALNTQTAS